MFADKRIEWKSEQNPHPASNFYKGDFDNAGYMRKILLLRQEKAELLGYSNWADLQMISDGRMANTKL